MEKQQRQLHTLVRELVYHVPDQLELSQILAYAIIDSLTTFSSTSGSSEERQFEEVKRVYLGLEAVIQECKENETYAVLCALRTKVTSYLGTIDPGDYPEPQLVPQPKQRRAMQQKTTPKVPVTIETSSEEPGSILPALFKNILHTRGDIEGKLQRRGLQLLETALERGYTGKRNILREDYNTIKESLTR
jgi:hypothetical protein